jgi:predicted small lipoprotein YifL
LTRFGGDGEKVTGAPVYRRDIAGATMARTVLVLTTVCALALAVSACGRKGKLEPPGSSAAPAIHVTV